MANNPIVNRRLLLEATRALVITGNPSETAIPAVLDALTQVVRDLTGDQAIIVTVMTKANLDDAVTRVLAAEPSEFEAARLKAMIKASKGSLRPGVR